LTKSSTTELDSSCKIEIIDSEVRAHIRIHAARTYHATTVEGDQQSVLGTMLVLLGNDSTDSFLAVDHVFKTESDGKKDVSRFREANNSVRHTWTAVTGPLLLVPRCKYTLCINMRNHACYII